MKSLFFTITLLLSFQIFKSQSYNDLKTEPEYEQIFKFFKNEKGSKLLYGIPDVKKFYFVLKQNSKYKQFAILITDKGKMKKRKIKTNNDNSLKKIFEEGYTNSDITKVENARSLDGKLAYYILKDENDNTLGEFNLPIFTFPSPIGDENNKFLILINIEVIKMLK